MAIDGFKFPGVELHQEFVAPTTVADSQLGVAIIGEPEGLTTAPALSLGVVTDLDDIVTKLGQVIIPQQTVDEEVVPAHVNKMALACYLAMASAPGIPIYYVAIEESGSDGSDFVAAMEFLERFPKIYSVVPLTTNATKLKACIAKAAAESENAESKVRRAIWCGIETGAGATTALKTSATIDNKNAIVAAGASGAYRTQVVWSPGAMYGGFAVPADVLAAAPAGMRAYEPTYRPISNLGYTLFSVSDTFGFAQAQLEQIGAAGVWVIDNNYDGAPVNKRQVTANANNQINLDEESIVANADSIALTLCHVGENLVGCSNISPALLTALYDTIKGIMDRYLINLTGNVYIGPQLLNWTFDKLEQDPVQLDKVYATITCEPPKPFNRFVMTLRIV